MVGNSGSERRRRCASRRSGKRTAGGEACPRRRRPRAAARPGCGGAATRRGSRRPPGWPPIRRPRRPGRGSGPWSRIATSCSFCLAKAIQPFSSASSAGSLSRSIGQCRSEQEGATMIRSGPSLAAAFSSRSSDRSRSARHTLRPSITPSESVMPGGAASSARSNCSGAATRSRCTAATGSFSAAARLSPQIAEIGRQANPNLIRRRGQPRAGRFQRVQRLLGQIEGQHRLVDLHPVGPGVGQLPKHFFIDRQQLVEKAQRLRLRRLALAQQQERQRPEQHGPGVDAQRRRPRGTDRPAWSRRA